MKYKVGDKVRIKSIVWYNENKNEYGEVFDNKWILFNEEMSLYCGKALVVESVGSDTYEMVDNPFVWTDEMIMGLAEKDINVVLTENLINFERGKEDKIELNLGDYELQQENGKWFAIKKKPKYPATYKECCDVLGIDTMDNDAKGYKHFLVIQFQELLIARDAYWKIAGWEPDYKGHELKFYINTYKGEIDNDKTYHCNRVLAFPTEEMRDTFYENFKDLINECKELL